MIKERGPRHLLEKHLPRVIEEVICLSCTRQFSRERILGEAPETVNCPSCGGRLKLEENAPCVPRQLH